MILCARFAVGHEANSAFASAGDAERVVTAPEKGREEEKSSVRITLLYLFPFSEELVTVRSFQRAYIVVAAIFQHLIAWLENWIGENGTERVEVEGKTNQQSKMIE